VLTLIARRPLATGLATGGLDGVTPLFLAGLDDASARQLVASLTGDHPPPPHVIDALVARAGGNPLFLAELASAPSVATAGELPATIEEIVAASVDVLAPADRQVLRSASVLGVAFSRAELEHLVGPLSGALAHLGRFVVDDGPDRLRFRNGLQRDVAYEGLPYRTRRRLHRETGDFLERQARPALEATSRAGNGPDDGAELLALHFHAAGDHRRAWRYARTAGQRAQHNGAFTEAATFYRWALDAATALADVPRPERAEVWERLGDVCELGARYAEATAAYRGARALRPDDPLALAYLCHKEGWVRERSDRYVLALRWFTKGFGFLAQAPPGEAVERCRARLTLAQGDIRLRQGHYPQAIALLDQAAAGAERLGDQASLAHAYTLLYWAHGDLGSNDRHRYQRLALPIFEALEDHHGQAKVLNNLGAFLYYEGRWDEAIDHYQRAAVAHGRAGDVVAEAMTANNVAEIQRDRGRLEEATARFVACLHTVRAARHPLAVAYTLANLGLTDARAGRQDCAADRLADARRRLVAIGASEIVLETDTKECERLVLGGQAGAALALADVTLLEVERLGGIPSLSVALHRGRGYALAQLGRPEEAWPALTRSRSEGESAEARFEVALTEEAMARVGPDPAPHRAAAAALFAQLGVVATPQVPLLTQCG